MSLLVQEDENQEFAVFHCSIDFFVCFSPLYRFYTLVLPINDFHVSPDVLFLLQSCLTLLLS